MANVKTAEANRPKSKARRPPDGRRLLTPSPKSGLAAPHPKLDIQPAQGRRQRSGVYAAG
jgi:hypothetical protein